VVLALRSSSRHALLRTLPAEVRAGRLRWWQLIGGFASAFFVVTQGASIPALGVAVFTVLVVAGTTGSSLLFDAVGLTPGGRRRVTSPRVIGAVGTTLAVVVAVSGQFSAGSLALGAVIVTITAGVVSTFQMAINGMVAEATDDGLVPTTLNLALGIVVLLVALPLTHALTGTPWMAPPAPWDQPLVWLGGPLGVSFLLLSAIVVRPLGVLVYSLVAIGGQLVGALALDVVVPTSGAVIGWQVVLGVALTAAAVAVAALPSPRHTAS
jgi:transporter family-2 protein